MDDEERIADLTRQLAEANERLDFERDEMVRSFEMMKAAIIRRAETAEAALSAANERHGALIESCELESGYLVSQLDWSASVLSIVRSMKQDLDAAAAEIAETILSQDAVCDSYAKENQRLSDELSAAQSELERLRVPEGWQVVPKEPTKEHFARALGIERQLLRIDRAAYAQWSAGYQTAISAAPQPGGGK